MIKLFKVTGFKGFADTFSIDFSKTRDYKFCEDNVLDGYIKNAIIYGRNSVGKTNFGLAILDITAHLSDNNIGPRLYDYYLNVDSDYAEFEYEFIFGQDIIKYKYAKTDLKELIYENLSLNDELLLEYDYKNSKINLDGVKKINPTLNFTFQNSGSVLKFILNNTALQPESPLYKFMKFVSNMLWFRTLEENRYIGYRSTADDYFTFMLEDRSILKEFESLLAEIGVYEKLSARRGTDGVKKLYVNKNDKFLPFFNVASNGTKALYTFFYWHKTAKEVSFICIDEFDAYYHYELSEVIIKLLQNYSSAQSLVTTHNTNLLSNSISRPDCYFILTKDKIVPIVDSTDRELREGHNLEKLYKSGEFDG